MKIRSIWTFRAHPRFGTLDLEGMRSSLLYDAAFVRPDDLTRVIFVHWTDGHGAISPTVGMWSAHACVRFDPSPLDGQDNGEVRPDDAKSYARDWVTYQHPEKAANEGMDYGTLVPVTLDTFLRAKSLEEVRRPLASAEGTMRRMARRR